MNCSDCKNYLPDLILGELREQGIEDGVREHLRRCPRCRREEEELRRAWSSLDRLAEVEFPRRLSRSVLKELDRDKKAARRTKPGWTYTPSLVYLRAAAVILLLIFGVILGVRYLNQRGSEVDRGDRSALTVRPGVKELPDVDNTLNNYLDRSGEVLSRLQRGEYRVWEDLMADVFRNDIQGRAYFLLENLKADSAARPVVEELRAAFSSLLKTAREGKGEAPVPPSELDISRLLEEIRNCPRAGQGGE